METPNFNQINSTSNNTRKSQNTHWNRQRHLWRTSLLYRAEEEDSSTWAACSHYSSWCCQLSVTTAVTKHQFSLCSMPSHTVCQKAHTESSESKLCKINLNSQTANKTELLEQRVIKFCLVIHYLPGVSRRHGGHMFAIWDILLCC